MVDDQTLVHGFLQYARKKASDLQYKVTFNDTRGFVIWLQDPDDGWYEAGALRRKPDVEAFLSGLLPTTE